VRERRAGHVGTISGLALLTGATALAAVAGGRHSIFATLLLGLLAVGMAHSLFVELRRQGRRRAAWSRHDTINTVVLAVFGEAALLMTMISAGPEPVRAVGPFLCLGYAAACALFVTERRRAMAAIQAAPRSGGQDPDPGRDEDALRLDGQFGGGQPVEPERLRPDPVVGAQPGFPVGDRHGEN
jgi:hypothetical protein